MKAIVTTKKDLSATFFEQHEWDVYLYDELSGHDSNYDVVYLRDPFNDQEISPRAKEYVENALKTFHFSKSIDNITTYEQIESFEDKYRQYMLYSDYMPNTFLPSNGTFCNGKHLAKNASRNVRKIFILVRRILMIVILSKT